MADKFIEIKIENEREIKAKFTAIEERSNRELRNLLDNFSELGRALVAHNVPVHSRVMQEHVDRTHARWSPGGAGGGGGYEAAYGVKRLAGSPPYPLYVEFGTGLYGTRRNYIYPKKSASMSFYSTRYNRWISVRRTRGQRATRFFYASWLEFQVYAAARILTYDVFH
jgi:hypothetical protein